MIKRLLAVIMAAFMIMPLVPSAAFAEAETNNSKQLMVRTNQLVLADEPDTTVRLVGVNLPGGEWTGTPAVERLTRNIAEAVENWNSNCLRVPVNDTGWYGEYSYVSDGGTKYRAYIDSVIDIASEYGVYVILDFHRYGSFNSERYLEFWRDAARRYKNNPTVLFGILNEPHDTTWEVWRNGNGSDITGHQQIVEMIRDLGAENIIVAGGLSWAYNLSGIANGYALVDCGSNNNTEKTGYGIMYDSHIYPWKGLASNWYGAVGQVRELAPVIIGEVGWDPDTNLAVGNKVYEEGSDYYHDKWCPAFFEWADDAESFGSQAHYTAYSFHPVSSPRMLGDRDNFKDDENYSYPPTEFWGAYVKEHLASVADKHYGRINLPVSISVSDVKTSYVKGYPIDRSRGTVTATYADGSTEEIPLSRADVTVEGFDSSALAESQTITVGFREQQTEYTIEVKPFAVMGDKTPDESIISKKYLDIDFEGAAYHVNEDSTVDDTVIDTLNKATGNTVSVATYPNKASVVYKILTDSTTYIAPGRKNNVAFDFRPEESAYEAGKFVYADFRVKRVDYVGDDPVSIYFTDDEGNRIFGINYAGGKIPTLIASQSYGTETNVEADTEVTYPFDGGWHYIRAVINFETATFELYQGDSPDSMTNFVEGVDYFGFISPAAANLGRITNYGIGNRKGALAFDDIKIYTVNPTEESVKPKAKNLYITGDLIQGSTLTGFYSAVNTNPSNTKLYWDISDTADFAEYTTVSEGFDTYEITEAAVGKYVRFRVLPVADDMTEGDEVSVASQSVVKAAITGIEITDPKTDYYVRDTFDYSVGRVKVSYSDLSEEYLYLSDSALTISGFDSGSAAEAQVITVGYKGVSASYTISIKAREYDGGVNYMYADENFDDAAVDVSGYITDEETGAIYVPASEVLRVNTTNAATGEILPWYTKNMGGRSSLNDFYAPVAVGQNEDGTTNYAIMPNGSKKQATAYFTMDRMTNTIDPETGELTVVTEPAPVTSVKDERVYIDLKIKRCDLYDDDVSLWFADSSDRSLFSINYKSNYYPYLSASQNYGYVKNGEAGAPNYPFTTDWIYIRAVLRFDNSTFQLYVGYSEDSLKPFIDSVENYSFANSAAQDIYKITASAKGSLGIDDFKLYSVLLPETPSAENITLSGKLNYGSVLTASYEYSCAESEESGSAGWWEASSDPSFINPQRLTEPFSVTAGTEYTYTIGEEATGRYIRFCVDPCNAAGTSGDTSYSDATQYRANTVDAVLSVTGNIKNGTGWDFKHASNSYGGRAVVTSTLSEDVSYKLVAAFYRNTTDVPELVGIKSADIILGNAAQTESGVISEAFVTDTVYTVPGGTSGSDLTIKVFAVTSAGSMTPVGNYVYAGHDF